MEEEDTSEYDIKGHAISMRGFIVYFQVQRHVALDENVRPLTAAFANYEDWLYKLYNTYTWESVRSFHLNFHQLNDRATNPDNWSKVDTSLESLLLIKRDRPPMPNVETQSNHRAKIHLTAKVVHHAFVTIQDENADGVAPFDKCAKTANAITQSKYCSI